MKVSILTITLLFIFKGLALSQQESLFSQYMFNRLVINPAYAGTKQGLSITALSRLQWTGFDGAPRTGTLSAHAPILQQKHGIGGYVIYDKIGFTAQTGAGLSYAYRIPTGENSRLSFGLQFGASQFKFESNAVTTNEIDDPQFNRGTLSKMKPLLGAGTFFNTGRFYIGASALHIIEQKYAYESNAKAKLARHYYFTAGYDMYLSKASRDFILSPSVFVRGATGSNWQFDGTLVFMYIQKFWIGTSYRNDDAVVFLAGVYPTKQLRLGYSYDLGMSTFKTYHNGSHEIMISYDFYKGGPSDIEVPRLF